jgi:hypothetical protein
MLQSAVARGLGDWDARKGSFFRVVFAGLARQGVRGRYFRSAFMRSPGSKPPRSDGLAAGLRGRFLLELKREQPKIARTVI